MRHLGIVTIDTATIGLAFVLAAMIASRLLSFIDLSDFGGGMLAVGLMSFIGALLIAVRRYLVPLEP